MIISFIYYVALSKFVDSSFPQCNVHTGVQGECLAFPPLDGYLNLPQLYHTACAIFLPQMTGQRIISTNHLCQTREIY